MKAQEIIKLAEMVAAFKKEDKPMRSRRGPPRFVKKMKDDDVISLLHKRLDEAAALKHLLEEREKLNKKEDKKKNDGPSIEQIAIFLVATYPIIGAILYLLVRH